METEINLMENSESLTRVKYLLQLKCHSTQPSKCSQEQQEHGAVRAHVLTEGHQPAPRRVTEVDMSG